MNWKKNKMATERKCWMTTSQRPKIAGVQQRFARNEKDYEEESRFPSFNGHHAFARRDDSTSDQQPSDSPSCKDEEEIGGAERDWSEERTSDEEGSTASSSIDARWDFSFHDFDGDLTIMNRLDSNRMSRIAWFQFFGRSMLYMTVSDDSVHPCIDDQSWRRRVNLVQLTSKSSAH